MEQVIFENGEVIYTVVRRERIKMSDAMRHFIGKVCQHGNCRVDAIRLVRAEYSLGLKEAKEIVDAIIELEQHRPVNLGQLLRDKLDYA